MSKRKKYPRLPNGFGSIRYLGKNRRNPYAVHPPTTEFTPEGRPKTPKALCYVDNWMTGFAVLTALKCGFYYPGIENDLSPPLKQSSGDELVQKILADYNRVKATHKRPDTNELTFSDVYQDFFRWKYERNQSRKYAKSTMNASRAAYNNCAELHQKVFAEIRHQDLQNVIDKCTLKHASKELILTLFHQMYDYAEIYELCAKNYSAHLRINTPDNDEHGVPFSDSELQILWNHTEIETVSLILIMCYSGYRISAYSTLNVDLKEKYFQGGIKTVYSRNRIVPIHPAIYPLVEKQISATGKLFDMSPKVFRSSMYDVLKRLGIPKHTPHDCRHTFSTLCEKYKVNENDRKRMLGHSFHGDITNQIYGHRSLEDLRIEIEKIKVCY